MVSHEDGVAHDRIPEQKMNEPKSMSIIEFENQEAILHVISSNKGEVKDGVG